MNEIMQALIRIPHDTLPGEARLRFKGCAHGALFVEVAAFNNVGRGHATMQMRVETLAHVETLARFARQADTTGASLRAWRELPEKERQRLMIIYSDRINALLKGKQ